MHAPRAIHRRARVTRRARAHAAPRASVVVPRARIGIDVIGFIHLGVVAPPSRASAASAPSRRVDMVADDVGNAGKLAELREAMASRGVRALIVPSQDPHFSEYMWRV